MPPIRDEGFWHYWFLVRLSIGTTLMAFNVAGLLISLFGSAFDRAFWNPKECVTQLVVGILITPFSEMLW